MSTYLFDDWAVKFVRAKLEYFVVVSLGRIENNSQYEFFMCQNLPLQPKFQE